MEYLVATQDEIDTAKASGAHARNVGYNAADNGGANPFDEGTEEYKGFETGIYLSLDGISDEENARMDAGEDHKSIIMDGINSQDSVNGGVTFGQFAMTCFVILVIGFIAYRP